MIRVIVVDDHGVVRQGVAHILERAGAYEVVGEAVDGPTAIDVVLRVPADVCILDLDMPGGGIALIDTLRDRIPDLHILVLSQHAEADFALRCLEAGALGYCSKLSGYEAIEQAVRRVAAGHRYLSGDAQDLIGERLAHGMSPRDAPHIRLSTRELEIMLLLAHGRRVGEVAAELGISFKTVSTHRSRILEKLGVTNTVEMALYAREHGLL